MKKFVKILPVIFLYFSSLFVCSVINIKKMANQIDLFNKLFVMNFLFLEKEKSRTWAFGKLRVYVNSKYGVYSCWKYKNKYFDDSLDITQLQTWTGFVLFFFFPRECMLATNWINVIATCYTFFFSVYCCMHSVPGNSLVLFQSLNFIKS